MLGIGQILFLLFAGHMLVDFALQTEWVATNKNRHLRDKFTAEQRSKMELIWPWLLSAHAFQHGFMVFMITRNLTLGIAETAVHWIIDFGKCERWYNFHVDQILHILCKCLWAYLLFSNFV